MCIQKMQKSCQDLLFDVYLLHQTSDKRQLGKCGNDESYLVETKIISILPSGRHTEKPKFEHGLLESQSSINYRKKIQKFFQC
jgi:hypothetical protein